MHQLGTFSALTGVNITTASYWGRVRPDGASHAFSAWVPLLLAAWVAHPELVAHQCGTPRSR